LPVHCHRYVFVATRIWPLCPYSTLFRSDRDTGRNALAAHHDRHRRSELRAEAALADQQEVGQRIGAGGIIGLHVVGELTGLDEADRKSTRLNASHVKTSYAVFCLRKKNK